LRVVLFNYFIRPLFTGCFTINKELMKKINLRPGIFTVLISLTFCFTNRVHAQDGYFTTYGHRVAKGELEICMMTDFTSPSKYGRMEGMRNYLSEMPEIEYSPSDQLCLEFMPEAFQEFGTGIAKFTGLRFEARYRLFKKYIPFNPTIYFEYEDLDIETRFKMETSGWILPPYTEEEEESGIAREKVLENRIILSQDLGNWNVALNWINEIDTRTGFTGFGYACGVQYGIPGRHSTGSYYCTMHPSEISDQPGKCPQCGMDLSGRNNGAFLVPASLSFELVGALGDEGAAKIIPWRQEHYFQPSIMLHMPGRNMLCAGFAFGLTDASDDLLRLMWMKEF
jgi:hypothetical protein